MVCTNDSIYEIIKRSKYSDEFSTLYTQTPVIGKESCWKPLGDKISSNEKSSSLIIPPEKYIVINVCCKLFFSGNTLDSFDEIMKTVTMFSSGILQRTLHVFRKNNSISIVIDKVCKYENENSYVHEYAGRMDKLLTLVNSKISTKFVVEFAKKYGINFDSLSEINFSSNIETYNTIEEAFKIIHDLNNDLNNDYLIKKECITI